MNTGYLIYQAERPRSRTEQRQVDIAHAELARSASRRWHALTAALRALRPAERRPAERRPAERRPAERRPAERRPAEGRPECLTGQHV